MQASTHTTIENYLQQQDIDLFQVVTADVVQLDTIITTIRREFQLSSEQLIEYLNDKYVLHVACESGSPEMLGYLLGLGLSMHVKNASGNTPLYMLINNCYDTSTQTLKKISILLQSDPNNMYLHCDPDNLEDEIEFATLLQWVIASGHIDFMCNLQMSEYVDITAVEDGVDTILHFMFKHIMAWIKRGEEEVLESLINTTIYLIVHYPAFRQHAGEEDVTVHTLAQKCYRQCTDKQASWRDSIRDVIRLLTMPVINKAEQDAADMIIVQAYVAAQKTLVRAQDSQSPGQSSCENASQLKQITDTINADRNLRVNAYQHLSPQDHFLLNIIRMSLMTHSNWKYRHQCIVNHMPFFQYRRSVSMELLIGLKMRFVCVLHNSKSQAWPDTWAAIRTHYYSSKAHNNSDFYRIST